MPTLMPLMRTMSNVLPGRLLLEPGTPADYFELERFHYLPKAPRTWQAVWVARYAGVGEWERGRGGDKRDHAGARRITHSPTHRLPHSQLVAVAVLSWPVPTILARDHHFGMVGSTYGQKLRFANQHIRTISRVVVHPQFRSLGLATRLIECLCHHCPTRYVDALAMMGHAHPMFERAGMQRLASDDPRRPAYYILDRHTHSPKEV